MKSPQNTATILELSSLSFNYIRWGTTQRGKWPSYDVEGHEDDFNRRFRLKGHLKKYTHPLSLKITVIKKYIFIFIIYVRWKKLKAPLFQRLQESGVVYSSKNNIGLNVQKSFLSGDFAKTVRTVSLYCYSLKDILESYPSLHMLGNYCTS